MPSSPRVLGGKDGAVSARHPTILPVDKVDAVEIGSGMGFLEKPSAAAVPSGDDKAIFAHNPTFFFIVKLDVFKPGFWFCV